jgi:hypothetical protein
MNIHRRFMRVARLGVGILSIVGSTSAFANERCEQLQALSQQYANVQLTLLQKQMKQQMVLWYGKNCLERRSADAN